MSEYNFTFPQGEADPGEGTRPDDAERGAAATQTCRGVDVGKSWFKVSNHLFASGVAQQLGPYATVLYVALCECANHQNPPRNTFFVSDKSLASLTGISPRALHDARIRLVKHEVLQLHREAGSRYEYTLLPQNFRWKRKEERPRAKKQPRGRLARRSAEPFAEGFDSPPDDVRVCVDAEAAAMVIAREWAEAVWDETCELSVDSLAGEKLMALLSECLPEVDDRPRQVA